MGTHLECVGSSPRVLGACQDSSREFAGRRPGLVRRLSEVAEKLVKSCKSLQVDLLAMLILPRNFGSKRRLDRLGRRLYCRCPGIRAADDDWIA
ncbi:hypothetical protein B296_00031413 [Ensete ventricosum]|uniref:Uncharacterized protein n=1 Tax=Ensete ventricosum TaxID=4639 RepID=A0A426XQ47_ENSVE|nr:hypothetical protein B296_00031413 [Ensete ventricosum]